MRHYLLDTSALLTLRDDEPGADRVAELLGLSGKNKVRCSGCFMSLMEVLYRVWKDEGEAAGRLAYEQCLSLADAWIAASAQLSSAVLVHKDPEFESLSVKQEILPYK